MQQPIQEIQGAPMYANQQPYNGPNGSNNPMQYAPQAPYMQQPFANGPQPQYAPAQGYAQQPGYAQQQYYGQQQPYYPPQQPSHFVGEPYNPQQFGYSNGANHYSMQPGAGGLLFDDIQADKLLTEDLDISIRNGFVRKVYGILSAQLLITFGMATTFNVWRDSAVWLYQNPAVLIVCAIVMIASVCTLSCVPKVARKAPTNYILLGVIAICMGFVLGYSTGAVDTISYAVAAGMTAAVAVSISLFACQTKYDFTGCGVYAFVGLILLMLFGVCTMFFRNRITQLVYASLGAALFSFYLIIDTQMIVGGKHRSYQFSIDDYCFAALTLYLDIINLFTYILQIVAASRSD